MSYNFIIMGIFEQNYRILKKIAYDEVIFDFKVTEIEDLIPHFENLSYENIKDLKHGISIAVRVLDEVLNTIEDHPTRLYLHHYKNLNYYLDRVALKLSFKIEEMGFRALPIPASQIVDWKTQKAHLSHKMIAKKAGMGWIGRNNLIVHPEKGAKIRLATILTDMPLKIDTPIDRICTVCRKCVEICPADALGETPEDYNMERCLEKLREFAKKYGFGSQHICGLCVKVCNAEKEFREWQK
jgi:epoxyqueuosine reductase QueG